MRSDKENSWNYRENPYQKFVPGKFEYTRPSSTSKLRDYSSERIQENPLVASYEKTIDLLKEQIRHLQAKNNSQEQFIENLQKENSMLKTKLGEKVLTETNPNKPRPQSCLKTNSSSPKKGRVAFAKDLIKVKYIPVSTRNDIGIYETENLYERPLAQKIYSNRVSEFETPSTLHSYDQSLKSYLEEKRAQMARLTTINADTVFSDYYRERSNNIWRLKG
ncbi:hypothetical protein SteCoe_20018 [Stentor coeruleus]|uniref:Uncharacterized protein n=1 Tax=Stentor coeruleus TaxID=5963 RepID=A0A1R2BST2_9CILI|nr:hypothetical protein SteCoe_20018 [Stentor coeruleus]